MQKKFEMIFFTPTSWMASFYPFINFGKGCSSECHSLKHFILFQTFYFISNFLFYFKHFISNIWYSFKHLMFFQKSVVLLNKNFKMKCNSYKLPGSGLNRLGYLGNKIVTKLVQTIAFERITDIISYLSKTNFFFRKNNLVPSIVVAKTHKRFF